jgi:hypothetical protein
MSIAVVRKVHLPFSFWLFRHVHYSTYTPILLERGMCGRSAGAFPRIRDNQGAMLQ